MAHQPAKNVLLDGTFIHQAALMKDSGVRYCLIELFGTTDIQEYTTKCVKEELKRLSKKRKIGEEYEVTASTAKSLQVTECSFAHPEKLVKGAECVLSVLKVHKEESSDSDYEADYEKEEAFHLEKLNFSVATNDKKFIALLKEHYPDLEIITIVDGKAARV